MAETYIPETCEISNLAKPALGRGLKHKSSKYTISPLNDTAPAEFLLSAFESDSSFTGETHNHNNQGK